MSIKIFNTLTRKKEDFKPLDEKEIRMYSCGPTVYYFAHIGNLRAYLFMDNLRRVLKYNGYNFYLSHYPALTSNYDYDKPLKRKVISLCGHTHTKDPFADVDKGLIFHCELDTNDCYPWCLDDIITKIKERI